MRMLVDFRCDAGGSVGMGHLERCQAIASWLDREDVCIVVAADDAGKQALAGRPGIEFVPDGLGVDGEIAWWRSRARKPDCVLFDISHPARTIDAAATLRLVGGIGRDGARIGIDGFGQQALYADDAPIDAVVAPYVGTKADGFRRVRVLAGAAYFVVPRHWKRRDQRSPADPVRRILVTMGGSDPSRLTKEAVVALKSVADSAWIIRVVIGPAFAESAVRDILAATEGDARFDVGRAADGIVSLLQDCDLAVASTGLTKYELAWAGTPSVQISHSDEAAAVSGPFALSGTAIHLGSISGVRPTDIARAVVSLAADLDLRRQMSARGLALVDGLGGARLADELRETASARSGI